MENSAALETPELTTPSTPPEPENEEARREKTALYKNAKKALDQLRSALIAFPQSADSDAAIGILEAAIEAHRPPDPRRCKEYLRALQREKKGMLGISPNDVALYCRCPECTSLRGKLGLKQPGE